MDLGDDGLVTRMIEVSRFEQLSSSALLHTQDQQLAGIFTRMFEVGSRTRARGYASAYIISLLNHPISNKTLE